MTYLEGLLGPCGQSSLCSTLIGGTVQGLLFRREFGSGWFKCLLRELQSNNWYLTYVMLDLIKEHVTQSFCMFTFSLQLYESLSCVFSNSQDMKMLCQGKYYI